MCEEFSGWTNRETWAVALYLGNDQGFCDEIRSLTREAIDNEPSNEAAYRLADSVKEWVNDLFEFDNVSTNEQLFNMLYDIGSLYRVNWRELAQTYINTMTSDIAIGLQGVAL
jgi:hypothetical protein